MLVRRRDETADAALSVGGRREDRVQVGTECGDRGEGLLELSLSCLHISRIFRWQGMGGQVRERMVEVKSESGREWWSPVEPSRI